MHDRIATFAATMANDAREASALACALRAQGRSPWLVASLDRIARELQRAAIEARALAERHEHKPETIGEVLDRWVEREGVDLHR